MRRANHSLDAIQRWMQAVITWPGSLRDGLHSAEAKTHIAVEPEGIEKVIGRSMAMTGLERLSIYGNAYHARLLESMREEFPALVHALGREVFDQFSIGYLREYPSRSYTLNQLSADFPRFLAESRPAEEEEGSAEWPDFLIDLANLELSYSRVFDGPGVERQRTLRAEDLRSIPAESWPEARLVPVPCLRLWPLRFPVHEYATAVRRGQHPKLPAPADTWLAVTRRNYVVRRFPLRRLEYVLLAALMEGQTVGEALTGVAKGGRRELERLTNHLHSWFRRWVALKFFRAAEWK